MAAVPFCSNLRFRDLDSLRTLRRPSAILSCSSALALFPLIPPRKCFSMTSLSTVFKISWGLSNVLEWTTSINWASTSRQMIELS